MLSMVFGFPLLEFGGYLCLTTIRVSICTLCCARTKTVELSQQHRKGDRVKKPHQTKSCPAFPLTFLSPLLKVLPEVTSVIKITLSSLEKHLTV